MNFEQIRSFLEIAETGNFNRAAENLNVTQSTVSARIKALEDRVGRPLFKRGQGGAELTPSGRQLQRYALSMQRLWERARQEIALPEGFRGTVGLGVQMSLWPKLAPGWIATMRAAAPDLAVHVEADYSGNMMRLLTDGVLDLAVMYEPRRSPGFVIEKLIEEPLVLVATTPRRTSEDFVDDYVYVDWGPVFRTAHAEAFPHFSAPAVSVGLGQLALEYILQNGGSGYVARRHAEAHIARGALHPVADAPELQRAAWLVYPENPEDEDVHKLAVDSLRDVAGRWPEIEAVNPEADG